MYMCATFRFDPVSRWISGGQLTETGYGHNSLDIHRTVVKLGGNMRLVSANISVKFQLDWSNIHDVID